MGLEVGLRTMKIFHCAHCDQLIFFENTSCVSCGHALAFLPECMEMASLEPDGRVWRAPSTGDGEGRFRLCQNYSEHNVCNWAVPAEDPNPYCRSCRLTRTIPDLSLPANKAAWARLEMAKRRMIYSLLVLKLPLASKFDDPGQGLAYEFLADAAPNQPGAVPVLTGHENGVITINIAEADDAERERRRHQMHEPYRTILGHFRHEIGHYYWDRLIRDSSWLEPFRERFGDERQDYNEALRIHHQEGAPPDWPNSFVSAYASSHPWEDWAETWAHYLHMVDTLDTAVSCGLSLRPRRSNEPAMKPDISVVGRRAASFDELVERWFPLTYVLNNLNRGMGLADAYPFVLPPLALEKLRFVHEVIDSVPPSTASDRKRLEPAAMIAS